MPVVLPMLLCQMHYVSKFEALAMTSQNVISAIPNLRIGSAKQVAVPFLVLAKSCDLLCEKQAALA